MGNLQIGDRIKNLRKTKNKSQKELAIDIDVSNSFLSAIENNNKKVSLELLEKICQSLDITMHDFFSYTDNPIVETNKLIFNIKSLSNEQIKIINDLVETLIK